MSVMDAARHRVERNRWIAAAPLVFLAAILLRIGAPTIAPWVITTHTWIWCVVGAAYHAGWLRAHKDATARREQDAEPPSTG